MKHLIIVVIALFLTLSGPNANAKPPAFKYNSVHNSSRMLKNSCRACHAGSRMNRSITDTCMQCHGTEENLKRAEKTKILKPFYKASKGMFDIDLTQVFDKEFRHPVGETKGGHSSNERLPEFESFTPRHVECVDCHHQHLMKSERKFAGLRGVSKGGQQGVRANYEYEVCFNCHSDSYNLPVDQTNKRAEFNEDNPSYHPVVAEGKNRLVPSLIKPYTERKQNSGDISIIKCTDCHNNSDKNGPRGPHGSDYPFILAKNYSIDDGVQERPQEYALCYGCHKRSSILADVSFRYHSLHIRGDIVKGFKGTSCFTCHDAHGSIEYTHLIRFNRDVVFGTSTSKELKFVDNGEFRGECYLLCHDVDHNPKSY